MVNDFFGKSKQSILSYLAFGFVISARKIEEIAEKVCGSGCPKKGGFVFCAHSRRGVERPQKVEENRLPLEINTTYWELFSCQFAYCRKGLYRPILYLILHSFHFSGGVHLFFGTPRILILL